MNELVAHDAVVSEGKYRARALRHLVGILTEDDLNEMLNISEHTSQSWRVLGGGPKFVKLGKTIFYRIKDVEDWIIANLHSISPGREMPRPNEALVRENNGG